MLRFLARIWAKLSYAFKFEFEAARSELNARMAEKNAQTRRDAAAKFTAEAEAIAKRIEDYAEKEAKGFWLCENGHESETFPNVRPAENRPANFCVVTTEGKECGAEVKLVQRDLMSAKDKYESDRERNDAEKLAASHRAEAERELNEASEIDKTVEMLRRMGENSRATAEKIRKL